MDEMKQRSSYNGEVHTSSEQQSIELGNGEDKKTDDVMTITVEQANGLRRGLCFSCSKKLGIPIYFCKKGHNACSNCSNKGVLCEVCNDAFTIQAPLGGVAVCACNYAEYGCKEQYCKPDLRRHLLVCSFRDLTCPLEGDYIGCIWKGQLEELRDHIIENHNIVRGFKNMEAKNVIFQKNVVQLLAYKNNIFVLRLHSDKDSFHAYIQLIGDVEEALHFRYKLTIKKNEAEKIMFINKVWSYIATTTDICESGQCCALPYIVFKLFLVEGMHLKLSLKIHEDWNSEINTGGPTNELQNGVETKF